jgi:hypothetical protein
MIPREILKKIRQIELRTNRIVTELAAGWNPSWPENGRFGIGADPKGHFEGKMRPGSLSEAQKCGFLVKNSCSEEFNRSSEQPNRCWDEVRHSSAAPNRGWEEINRGSASSNRSWDWPNRCWDKANPGSKRVNQSSEDRHWASEIGSFHFSPS